MSSPRSAASSAITVIRQGQGPELLCVHGGASPQTTWSALAPLGARFTLALAYRRGFAPSPPPPGGRQDFAVDADDLAGLLDDRPHVIAHSCGGPGALLAAARRPEHVRSLSLLEPALDLPAGDPDVAELRRLGEAVLAHGLDTEPGMLREFLRGAGAPMGDGPLARQVANGVRRAHGSRSPFEARPDLEVLRAAGIPTLIASGAHLTAVEHVCEALAEALDAQRLIAPGAGHFVAAAPGFIERLEQFLISTC
jgi:pimeloyl-ACP methyl ester carboxylesterase